MADHRFLQACMELIDHQEYMSWKLPLDWHIFLTSNFDNGEYSVNTLDVAQKTRYISFNLKYDEKEWAKWAEIEEIDGRCINFMLKYPEVVTVNNNPRALVTFFNSIQNIPDFENSLPLITVLGEGCVSYEVIGLFTEFINNKLDKLISPEEVAHKNYTELKKELTALVGIQNLGTYRGDIASILCTRFLNYSLKYAENNPIKTSYLDRIETLIKDEIFGVDLGLYLVMELFKSNKFKELPTRPHLTKLILL